MKKTLQRGAVIVEKNMICPLGNVLCYVIVVTT